MYAKGDLHGQQEARIGHLLFSFHTWTRIGCQLSLSPRELEIVKGIFDDRCEQVIAGNLGISTHTVHTHISRLYQKLNVHSRVTLVLRIMAEHLER